ncbi:MAG: hypothetical protein R3E90_01385 [Marinicella sp.]|nr:hypothetical protein [Xanthomonadales bacterium]
MTNSEKHTEQVVNLSTGERMLRAFGPLGGGILLDVADLTTFGSFGLYLGPLVGALLGWWLATVYKFGVWGQCGLIFVAALYCALPLTSLVPLATVVFALIRFAESKKVVD